FIVHARIAILEGLSPKENREVPPLRYEVAHRLKADFPQLEIVLNGGLTDVDVMQEQLRGLDGVMVGREAYHNPYMLAEVDRRFFGDDAPVRSRIEVLEALRPYIAAHLAQGGALHHVTRHILGLLQGLPGARHFRRRLSTEIHRTEQPLALFDDAVVDMAGRVAGAPDPAPRRALRANRPVVRAPTGESYRLPDALEPVRTSVGAATRHAGNASIAGCNIVAVRSKLVH